MSTDWDGDDDGYEESLDDAQGSVRMVGYVLLAVLIVLGLLGTKVGTALVSGIGG